MILTIPKSHPNPYYIKTREIWLEKTGSILRGGNWALSAAAGPKAQFHPS